MKKDKNEIRQTLGQIPLRQTFSSKKTKISHFSWLRLGHSRRGEEGDHLAFV